MEQVNRLPRPKDPAALERLAEAQQLLCARAVSEEDCQHAVDLLLELARPVEEDGFGYSPALLTLASLYESGYEPAIQQDAVQAARYYISLLEVQITSPSLSRDLLEEAATHLCSLAKDPSCNLPDNEVRRLEALAAEDGQPSSAWLTFAAAEARRRWTEANEDPEVRKRRQQREAQKAEQRQRMLTEQRQRAQQALSEAEELRLQGNDVCRQGQLPGNAAAQQLLLQAVALYDQAVEVLSRCLEQSLPAEESSELRKQRALLRSNSAQVELSAERWAQAAKLAELSLKDEPTSVKTRYRLAKAQLGQGEWAAAAETVDQALLALKGQAASEREAFTVELWKLAEEVTAKLPDWRWSASKPEKRTAQDDYEKRIVGWWEYPGSSFEIRLEPWGALVFHEDTVKIELMKKGKLRWRGEVELISGMVLNLSFEPGSDVLVLEFIPPPEMPEKDQWSGPKRFTAKRKAVSKQEAADQQEQLPTPELAPEPAPEPAPGHDEAVLSQVDESKEEDVAAILAAAPKEVCLGGYPSVAGHYILQPEPKNGRPVYCRSDGPQGDQFLWFRGGNWGVTDSLKASALAAPWQVRCADAALQPLQLRRRSKWYARSGKNQEELVPHLAVSLVLEPEPSMDPAETSKDQGTTSANNLPSWVAETAVDVEDKELRVNVVFPPDLSVSLASLDMSASEGSLCLELRHSGSLEIPLPVKLSEEQREAPKAKWSEKTRTLKVRFVLD
ncbi:Uncharacterized protein SCF082_LOCUS35885 [Durusdinium trenchii]|uniref:Uncharacterized protein n=1 Tax=Durusdinium trenchii TaxID=1381693 RepID=A0ABP0PDT6_9DINO